MLLSSSSLLALAALPVPPAVAERVLGAFVFARHGDRTAKVLGSTQLTNLGYQQVYQTGSFYHDRYVAPDSPFQVIGISQPVVDQAQISATSPADDVVLQNSATGFLQGLYPPVGPSANQTLRNDSTVYSPLHGYQLIPVDLVTKGAESENAAWLTSTSGCQKAMVSSNSFYSSSLYHDLYDSTRDFYQSFDHVVSSVFANDEMSFRNAYSIYDYINVASIHNSTASTPLAGVSTADFHQLMTLASSQQYHLAYSQSEDIRAIAGAVLAAEALKGLNDTIASQGEFKLGIRFGSYATFLSYFGLSQLTSLSPDFAGVPHYASSMAWELVTNSTASGFPSPSEISVRYHFHNGTLSAGNDLDQYPLYGRDTRDIPWPDFVEQTKKIAVIGDEKWCHVCGNTDGKCAQFVKTASDPTTSTSSGSGGGMSLAVAGVIGAMVTLAVILGLEAVFLMLGGFRLSKKTPAGPEVGSVVTENKV